MFKNKVVLLGNSGVGKSNICTRIVLNLYNSNNTATIGGQFFSIKLYSQKLDRDENLQIWDTAGQERFRAMLPLYLREAVIIIIVIDVSNNVQEQFDYWINYYLKNKVFYSKYHSLIIIFNKIDLLHKNYIIDTINCLDLLSTNNQYEFIEQKLKELDVPHSNLIKISCKDNVGFNILKSCLINNIEENISKFNLDLEINKNKINHSINLNEGNKHQNNNYFYYIPGANYISKCF